MSTATRTPLYHRIDDEPLAYSVDRLAVAASVGKDTIWNALNDGSLTAVRVGRRLLIQRDEARRWLASLDPYVPATA